jgi:uncharacterized protein YbjT (DUF2867 family)
MKIVVAGGTGRIGQAVRTALLVAGHQAVAVSPATGVDTVTGAGLAAAVTGAGAVLDVTGPPVVAEEPATAFFRASTRTLLIAEMRAGSRHHVVLSAIGADRLGGYYRAKLAQEDAARDGAVPCTIVRTTALVESLHALIRRHNRAGTVRLPATPVQPVALADLVAALVRILTGPSADGVVEVAGPEPLSLDEFARRLLRATGDAGDVVTDPSVRPFFGLDITGPALLPGPAAHLGPTGVAGWPART